MRPGFAPCFVNYKKGALDSQLQVIKFISCLSTKTGRHDIAEILLKVVLDTINQIKSLNVVMKKNSKMSLKI
jgi:predicted metal-binding protein